MNPFKHVSGLVLLILGLAQAVPVHADSDTSAPAEDASGLSEAEWAALVAQKFPDPREAQIRRETWSRLMKQNFSSCSIDDDTREAREALDAAREDVERAVRETLGFDASGVRHLSAAYEGALLDGFPVPEALTLSQSRADVIQVVDGDEKTRLMDQGSSRGMHAILDEVIQGLHGSEAEETAAEVVYARFSEADDCANQQANDTNIAEVCGPSEEVRTEIARAVTAYRNALVRDWVRALRTHFGVASQSAPARVEALPGSGVFAFWSYGDRVVELTIPSGGSRGELVRKFRLSLGSTETLEPYRALLKIEEVVSHAELGELLRLTREYDMVVGEMTFEDESGESYVERGISGFKQVSRWPQIRLGGEEGEWLSEGLVFGETEIAGAMAVYARRIRALTDAASEAVELRCNRSEELAPLTEEPQMPARETLSQELQNAIRETEAAFTATSSKEDAREAPSAPSQTNLDE